MQRQTKPGDVMNYGKLKLGGFMARPDKIVYILREGEHDRFLIENNDSDMTERSEVHYPRTRRHITVARIFDKLSDGELPPGLRGSGWLFKGLAYPRFFDGGFRCGEGCVKEVKQKKLFSEYPELYPTAGRIYDDYSLEGSPHLVECTIVNQVPVDDKPSFIAGLFSPSLLRQLERFTVPQAMAEQIREYVKNHGKS